MKNYSTKLSQLTKLLQGLLLSTIAVTAQADDTEVFFTDSAVNSNVMFVMDNSGSMAEVVPGEFHDVGTPIQRLIDVGDDNENTAVENIIGTSLGNDWESIIVDSWWRTGIRFPDVEIPQGSTITKAYIRLTQSETRATIEPESWAPNVDDPMTMRIYIEDDTSPHDFDWGHRVLGRDLSPVFADYAVPVPTAVGEIFETIDDDHNDSDADNDHDIKDLVQAIINKGDWSEGDELAFIIKNDAGGLRYFNAEGENAPVLIVEFTAASIAKTRMEIMQSALKTVLTNAPDNLSVGIMNYGDTNPTSGRVDKPNGIRFPATAINSLARPIVEESIQQSGVPNWSKSNIPEPDDVVTVRSFLSEIVDSWSPRGMTPIVDALYEATLYYRGDPLYFGYGKAQWSWASHPASYAQPAPSLVEPILKIKDTVVCGDTYNKTIQGRWWHNNLENWLDGNTGGSKCPADVNNPSEATSSEANCPDTQFDCGESDLYERCLDWVPPTGHEECTGMSDGIPTGCHWVEDTEGDCLEYEPTPTARNKWCTFKVCKNVNTGIPAPEYVSPAISECQSNNIILMSDGQPEYKSNRKPRAVSRIRAMMGGASCEGEPFGFKEGRCGSELTHFIADPDNDFNPGLTGNQFINTFVIGFSSGITENAEDYLKSLVTVDDPATAPVEGYFSAQNEEELAEAFAETLESIAQEAKSQASPGYSVNVKSGLEHENDIYIPVFNKNGGSTWSGNLKKFKLVDDGDHRVIKGRSDTGLIPAMTELGLFKDSAWDMWSTSAIADGQDVSKGGVASKLTNPNGRKLYTNVAGSNLSASGNHLKASNSNIDDDMLWDNDVLGLDSGDAEAYRTKLINFIQGWSEGLFDDTKPLGEKGTARKHMGDMLHAEPVVITYPEITPGVKEQYIFAATNEGYLHAFDSTTGEEKWAFMPKEMLKNIEGQYTNEGKHIYGVDGNITYWKDEQTGKVYLFFGLRRGGNAYYGLDITQINSPKLMWKVSDQTAGFGDLGQSWSTPYIAKVLQSGTKVPVVVFSGGNDVDSDFGEGDTYDPAAITTTPMSNTGNNIYIVNLETGSLLWDMKSSMGHIVRHPIPGGTRILDVNRNGLLDRMYFADLGGNVWRLDLDETLGIGSTLRHFAQLGGSGANARKFYNEPDVAMLNDNGRIIFTVSVGSGMRPHPLNKVIEDHMFVLLDREPYGNPGTKILKSELAEVTIRGNETKTISQNKGFDGKKITEVSGLRGWYVDFPEDGEKVLATSITFEGSIIFTTLVPEALTVGELISVCAAPATQGRVYVMDILTGEPSMDLDRSGGDPNDNDVFSTISANEIPGTPQGVFNGLNCDSGSCDHKVDIRIGKKSTEIGLEDVSDVESVYWSAPSN